MQQIFLRLVLHARGFRLCISSYDIICLYLDWVVWIQNLNWNRKYILRSSNIFQLSRLIEDWQTFNTFAQGRMYKTLPKFTIVFINTFAAVAAAVSKDSCVCVWSWAVVYIRPHARPKNDTHAETNTRKIWILFHIFCWQSSLLQYFFDTIFCINIYFFFSSKDQRDNIIFFCHK